MKNINVKRWEARNGGITRFYLTGGNGEEFGYCEQREENRGYDSYYDRHRHCKGDDFVMAESCTVQNLGVLAAVTFKNCTGHIRIDFAKLDGLTPSNELNLLNPVARISY